MRLMFTTYAARAHFFPLVPLAWACVLAGHEVRMVSTPSLSDAVERSGLPGVAVGADIDLDARLAKGELAPRPPGADSGGDPYTRVVDNMARLQFDTARAMADGVVDFARSWRPDVIVHDPVTYAGPVAGQVLGVPTVGHLYGMARVPRLELADLWKGTTPRAGYGALFEPYGVEPRVQPDAWIDPRPASMRWPEEDQERAAVPSRPMRYVPYNGPGALPSWLDRRADRPRVCVTWGTTQQKKLGVGVVETFGDYIRAIARLDVEVVVTVGAADEAMRGPLRDLPERVRTVEWVPLGLLLSRCDAIVHTGGTGTLMTAAACGVPQLGVTSIPEGRFNTERLAMTGAGIWCEEAAAGADDIGEHTRRLLDEDGFREAAARLRDENRDQPAPADVVRALETIGSGEKVR
ncbi:nucleotide disphospho-sugar-binding domain-containing protein [Streptomyces sp. NPDC050560]|uniref:nucleotide disphospho-sugar-binding domain-containing protein n=1 Tax=Streptomyces sp. NPDC050560 TaxID=3365630 RepID=UPI0037AEFD3A